MDDVKETARIEAFSDGVFAVAITLLALNIQVPNPLPGSDSALLNMLLKQWPTYLAFVISFATVGVMWINHHKLFTHIKRADNTLLVLNLLLMLVIVLVPFPTALLATNLATHPYQHVAVLVYAGTFLVLAISFNLLWWYATYNSRLLGKSTDLHEVKIITQQYIFGLLLYGFTFILAWIYVPASVGLNLLLAIFFAIPGRKKRTQLDD